MSLKPTTLRLLTFLYTEDEPFLASYSHLSYLIPHLTDAGRRSLVSHGVRQGWLTTERIGINTQVRITSHGTEAVRRQFPAFLPLTERTGDEALIIFLNPPKTDPQFRYLRSLLVTEHAFALTRGVYLVPSWVVSRVKREVELSYRTAVVMMNISEWISGDKRGLFMQQYQLTSVTELYSGLSKEINQLLKLKQPFGSLAEREKIALFSVFDRLYSLIQSDNGYYALFFPQSPDPMTLLGHWRELLVTL